MPFLSNVCVTFSDTSQQEHLLNLIDITYWCLQFCLRPGANKGYVNDFWTILKKMNLFSYMGPFLADIQATLPPAIHVYTSFTLWTTFPPKQF